MKRKKIWNRNSIKRRHQGLYSNVSMYRYSHIIEIEWIQKHLKMGKGIKIIK